jgi:DNA-binding MarR family transcriptional regulator
MKDGRPAARTREKVAALTRLVLGIFRTNGELLDAGDAFTAPLGLSSARFQVLGAVALSAEPLSVPAVARAMGLTRQGVQKQVDQLAAQGLVVLEANPAHRRSPWVRLTPAGRKTFGMANRRWRRLAAGLVAPHSLGSLVRAGTLVERLGSSLAGARDAAPRKAGAP